MKLWKETDRHWKAVLAFFSVVAISQIFPQWSDKGSKFRAGGKKKQRN
jgi:hypothetical protein